MDIERFEDSEHGRAVKIEGRINEKDYKCVAYLDKGVIRQEGSWTTEDGTPKETLNT